MSFTIPRDHHRDRREKGDQVYRKARQAMTEAHASLQAEAEAFGEERLRLSEEERREHLETAAEKSLRQIGAERKRPRRQP